MLLNYYALQGEPFSPTSQPAWFFASRSHQAALQTLMESLKAGEVLALLLGDPGVGKTFLVHAALTHRDLQHLKIVHLWYPPCSFHETLQMIGWELGLDAVTSDVAKLANALHRALLTEHERGRQVVLVIDEAHTIPVESLERLVCLSHVRAVTGVPLLQVVLVGLPALWRHFSAAPWQPCEYRTAIRVTLAPLTYGESLAYIRHRLRQAGAGEGTVFTPGAVWHVAWHARGNPRVMNTLCTHMLLTGFAARQKPIAAHIAKNVITAHSPKSAHPRWWWGVTAAASILVVAGMVSLFSSTSRIVTEQSLRSFLPFTRSLLAGSAVETAQQPASTTSSPSVPTLSALPTPTPVASPPQAPTERLTRREVGLPSQIALSPRATPTPSVTTMITFPHHGAKVAQKIAVEGVIAGLQPDQHVFVCVQSQAFGRRIYPQGKVHPGPTGQWTVESIYRSPGYRYATFLVITTNTTSAALLNAQLSRKYGLHALPPGTEHLGTEIVVMRE